MNQSISEKIIKDKKEVYPSSYFKKSSEIKNQETKHNLFLLLYISVFALTITLNNILISMSTLTLCIITINKILYYKLRQHQNKQFEILNNNQTYIINELKDVQKRHKMLLNSLYGEYAKSLKVNK